MNGSFNSERLSSSRISSETFALHWNNKLNILSLLAGQGLLFVYIHSRDFFDDIFKHMFVFCPSSFFFERERENSSHMSLDDDLFDVPSIDDNVEIELKEIDRSTYAIKSSE